MNALLMGSDVGGVHSSAGHSVLSVAFLGAHVAIALLASARQILRAIFLLCSFLLRRWILRRCWYGCLLVCCAFLAASIGMRKLMLPLPSSVVC